MFGRIGIDVGVTAERFLPLPALSDFGSVDRPTVARLAGAEARGVLEFGISRQATLRMTACSMSACIVVLPR